MHRAIVQTLQIIRDYDFLKSLQRILVAIGKAAQFHMGTNQPGWRGFAATATAPASMSINIDVGELYQLADIDASAYGALAADTNQVIQQGTLDAPIVFNVSGVPTMTVGQAVWALICAQVNQVDGIDSDDPNPNGVVPYVNIQNPGQALQGPGGSGAAQNTARFEYVSFQVVYGAVATAGSNTQPVAPSGWVPVWAVNLGYGQTAIQNNQIVLANNAPQFPGLCQPHHGGVPGQGTKIQLTNGAEVQGLLPIGNCQAAPIYGTGNPNTNNSGAGTVGVMYQLYVDTSTSAMYYCTANGVHWQAVGQQQTPLILVTSLPDSPTTGPAIYAISVSGSGAFNLMAANSLAAGIPVTVKNADTTGSVEVSVTPDATNNDTIDGSTAVYKLGPGRSRTFITNGLNPGNWIVTG